MSHSGDKSGKNSLLINNWYDYNLDRDFYLFNTGISLLKVVYFNNHLDNLIKNIEINLRCFKIILIAFI